MCEIYNKTIIASIYVLCTIMKKIFLFSLLLITSLPILGQKTEEEESNLVFYDNCTNEIFYPGVDILNMPEWDTNIITVYSSIGDDWTTLYVLFEKLSEIDTIRIPKILFAAGSELHSQRWTYLCCDRICDDIETDYYENGNKWIEGTFDQGKPKEIREYYPNGNIQKQYFYEKHLSKYKRINRYDEDGNLIEYSLYTNKKRKSIERTYDKKGNLIEKDVEKYNIVR